MRRRASRPPIPEMGLDVPWAIRGESARLIEQQLQRFAEHPKELAERYELEVAAWEKRDADPFRDGPGYEMHGNVALIRFEGVVTKALSFWGWIFGGSASTEVLLETLKSAELDGAVKAVCLRVDSPGGTTRGVQLASDAIFAFRTKKAIWGQASDCAASSAFNILASCTKVYADSITAEVGSIGTMISFSDYSQMLAASGIRRELIVSGPLKGTGAFGSSLTPDQRAYLQSIVDTLTAKFKGNVARGRGFTPEQIDRVSDGRCYQADEALTLGLIDGISTLEDLLGPLQAEPPVVPLPAVTGPVEPPEDEGCDEDTESRSNTDRAKSAARDGAPAAQAEAPKEKTDMTKEEVLEIANAAAAAAVAPVRAEAEEEKKKVAALQAENATLKTANADLKASMEGTAQVVAQNAAEKGLAKLLAVAEGENDGPVLIAPKGEVAAAHRKAITALYATDPKAAEAYVASLKPIAKGTRVVSAGAPNAGSRASAPAFPFDLYHGTSTDAAYQEMVAWGAEQMAAGTNFANATEWINAYDRANPRRAEVA